MGTPIELIFQIHRLSRNAVYSGIYFLLPIGSHNWLGNGRNIDERGYFSPI
jgi:hypothetical protein